MRRPRIAFVPGDPNGIGPEITAKVLSDGDLVDADFLLIGDDKVIAAGEKVAGKSVNRVRVSAEEARQGLPQTKVTHLASEAEPVAEITPGRPTADAGRSSLAELDQAVRLAADGVVDGVCFAPLNKHAMRLGGMREADELHHLAATLGFDGHVSEINITDAGIWTSRVTSHVPLREVAGMIEGPSIRKSAWLIHGALVSAGVQDPKVAIAALNPHAGDGGKIGMEEIEVIVPAVRELRDEGMDVVGPYPADTLFVRAAAECINAVVTMYHDQGQIALKLQGFRHGLTMLGGLPVAVTTPAHGTAYDIVGKNEAFTSATEAALRELVRIANHKMATGQGTTQQ